MRINDKLTNKIKNQLKYKIYYFKVELLAIYFLIHSNILYIATEISLHLSYTRDIINNIKQQNNSFFWTF